MVCRLKIFRLEIGIFNIIIFSKNCDTKSSKGIFSRVTFQHNLKEKNCANLVNVQYNC